MDRPEFDLRLQRLVPAGAEQVWHALTDSAALAAWFWPATLAPSVQTDPRPGGRWRFAAGAGPSAGMAVSGEYVHLQRPSHLSFTWSWAGENEPTVVAIELSTVDSGTTLDLHHHGFATPAARDDHITGWSDCHDRLDRFVESRLGTTAVLDRFAGRTDGTRSQPGETTRDLTDDRSMADDEM